MRYRVVWWLIVVAGLVLLTACSKSKVEEMESGLDIGPKCADYSFPDLPGVNVDGDKVSIDGMPVEGKTKVKCESQIVSVGPELLVGLKPSPYPDLPPEELVLTEEMLESLTLVRWLGGAKTERLSSRYFVLPGQVFQCDVRDTSEVTCDGWVVSSYLVSVFEETAYEFNGKMATDISGLKFDFSKRKKDTEKETYASNLLVKSEVAWPNGVTNIWSSVLVRRDEYLRSGRATVCYQDTKYTCRDADVKLKQTQDFIISGTVSSWQDTFNNYLLTVSHSLEKGSSFERIAEPDVSEFLTDKFVIGQKRAYLSPSNPRVMVKWTDSYSVMHRRDGSGKVSASIEAVLTGSFEKSVSKGKEIAGYSESWIFYPAQVSKVKISESRCLMTKVVGGLSNTQLSGLSLKEVCN